MKNDLDTIRKRLKKAAPADRRRIRAALKRLRGRHGGENRPRTDTGDGLDAIRRELEAAIARRQERRRHRPRPIIDPNLPITGRKEDIVAAIRRHRVVIIAGETGSGKTTQIPRYCLEAGRGIDGMIGCTQPRRIAATSVAGRIAEEFGESVGGAVGYKIRFRDKTAPDTYIKIMTDGILLAEAQGDPELSLYDTLIVDEAHERSLNIDFTLGLLKRLLKRRPELKVIITSATIDTEKFSHAFDGAPVIDVSGRMYPVEVIYMPPEDEDDEDLSHVEMAMAAYERIHHRSRAGDVLIFMPTEQGIRELHDMMRGRQYTKLTILPLFARLTAADQARVFKPARGRKVIIATNIAETSITIPGIRYVIDTGLARISQYQPRSRTTALPIRKISRSSADQRLGRCGRVENGTCVRLYSEDDYANRDRFTPPEIVRANLADAILRMISLKLGDIAAFPFIDPPTPQRIRDGIDLLTELGAVRQQPARRKTGRRAVGAKAGYGLTRIGRIMARIPVDPRISRILIAAQAEGCIPEATVIAAALSIQDPRQRPPEQEQAADAAQQRFFDPDSDYLVRLNIWQAYHRHWQSVKSTGRMKKWCQAHFLSFRRMREWRDLVAQLTDTLREHRMLPAGGRTRAKGFAGPTLPLMERLADPKQRPAAYGAIHRAILSGFLSSIANKKEPPIFRATNAREVMVFPGSVLFDNPPPWLVAAEMVETSRLFARTCAKIDPSWIEPLGRRLCRYHTTNPRWSRSRERVIADETATLFGLVVVQARPVPYGPVDPAHATDLFIRGALVAGDLRQTPAFLTHNQQIVAEMENAENRIRRRDILVGPEDMVGFYRARLGHVYDMTGLKRLIREKGGDGFLRMRPADVRRHAPDPDELRQYPDQIQIRQQRLSCTYRFEPGTESDGVTISVPVGVASTLPPEALEWVVPGVLREKITALIRSLPKSLRRQLVPVADTVDTILSEMPRTEASLTAALRRFIRRRFDVVIPPDAWKPDRLPDHLRARIAIIGPEGTPVRESRDPGVLKKAASRPSTDHRLDALRSRWERTGITMWDFPDLPDCIHDDAEGADPVVVYPALTATEADLALRLYTDAGKALDQHRNGIAALCRKALAKDLKMLNKSLKLTGDDARLARSLGGAAALSERLVNRVVRDLCAADIRAQRDFEDHLARIRSVMMTAGQEKRRLCTTILAAVGKVRQTLTRLAGEHRSQPGILDMLTALAQSLDNLVPDHFVEIYDDHRLAHMPRYVSAIGIRAERTVIDPDKTISRASALDRHMDRLHTELSRLSPDTSDEKRAAVEEFFWMIEEYKVSLFAQELGTAIKISDKRLDAMARRIEHMV